MAAPSYTYSLTNGTTADASQVMQNFNDILNGITDGTKDLSINAITVAGAATFNGNVALGNASGDDISHTGSLATSIPIKTNNSYDIGSSTLGLRKLFLGNGGVGATCDIVSASHATTREYTIPDCSAAASFVMTEAAQTVNGAKTFGSSIVVGGNATGDSNLGTIASVSLGHYYEGTFDLSFTGAFSSGTITVKYVRVGKKVTLMFPRTTASASSATTLSAGGVPSSLRPTTDDPVFIVPVKDNGSNVTGSVSVSSSGAVTFGVGVLTGSYAGSGSSGFYECAITYRMT